MQMDAKCIKSAIKRNRFIVSKPVIVQENEDDGVGKFKWDEMCADEMMVMMNVDAKLPDLAQKSLCDVTPKCVSLQTRAKPL